MFVLNELLITRAAFSWRKAGGGAAMGSLGGGNRHKDEQGRSPRAALSVGRYFS